MTLRDEASCARRPSPASTCGVALAAAHALPALDPAEPVTWPDEDDILDAVNGFPRIPAIEVERLMRARNIRISGDRITRHRRRECVCTGRLAAPVAPTD